MGIFGDRSDFSTEAVQQGERSGIISRLEDLENNLKQIHPGAVVITNPNGGGTNPVPSANQLLNGDFAHSVHSWNDNVSPPGDADRSRECAHWFSHDAPAPGAQVLSAVTNPTTPNKTLKSSDHTGYSSSYCDWLVARGAARLTGTKTLDQQLMANFATNNIGNYYVSFIAARRNRFIEAPAGARLYAGIWDNTAGQEKFLTGSFDLSGAVTGNPATTIERRYKVFAKTDRGFTALSTEYIAASAPTDAAFSAGARVELTWNQIEGVLSVFVYRYTPSTGLYQVLEEIPSGARNYIDNNSTINLPATNYPTATDTEQRRAIFYTATGELGQLAVDGISAVWSTISFPIGIPSNYNQALTTGKQWLRVGVTEALNLVVPGCTSPGGGAPTTLTAPEAIFEAGHSGMSCIITDGFGVTSTQVCTFVDSSNITVPLDPGTTGDVTVRINGGGFYGIVLDLIHSGYQDNAGFAPNAQDARTLNSTAAPNFSTTGGSGGGGYGGGIRCVVPDTPIQMQPARVGDCETKPINLIRRGFAVDSSNLQPNFVIDLLEGFADCFYIETKNGFWKECSYSHRIITSIMDVAGTETHRLQLGDLVLTKKNGRLERSPIVRKIKTGRKQVMTMRLAPAHIYIAGWHNSQRRHRFGKKLNPLVRFWLWLLSFVYWLFSWQTTGGILAHNLKDESELLFN